MKILFFFLFLVSIMLAIGPTIDFIPPTPADGTISQNGSLIVNITVNSSALITFTWNFTNSNYSVYDPSLFLMLNLNNVSALGENESQVKDVSYNNASGNVTGGASLTDGKFGKGYLFTAATSYLSFADSPLWNLGSNNFTISFWTNMSSTSSAGFMGQSNGGFSTDKWAIYYNAISANKLTFHFNSGGMESNVHWSWNPNSDQWYLVTIVRNESNWYAYINGVQRDSVQTNSGSIPNSTSDLRIGADGEAWRYTQGKIDEVRFYNRSLSAAEITQQYYSNLNEFDVGNWTFEYNRILSNGNYSYQGCASDAGGESCTPVNTFNQSNYTLSGCSIINTPGLYNLSQNLSGAPFDISEIQGSSYACIKIVVPDVILDCNGFSILESGAAGLTWGIAANSSSTSNVTVKNCYLEGYDVGINLVTQTNSLIYNNTINNTVYTPISVNTANNVIIANNLIMNAINTQNTETNIYAGSGNLIENNSLSNGYGGIYLRSDNSIIRNNNITSHSYEGINIGAQTNISIYSNFINNTGSNGGIYLIGTTNSQVFNNSVYNSVNYGITAILSVINVNITNNFVSGAGHGTHFTAVFSSLIANNTFSATTGHGMFVQSSSDNFLADNVISAGTANGIYSVGSARNIFKWNNITSSSGQYGIFMTGEHGGDVIEFNNITNFTNAGVYAENFDNIPTTISYNNISTKGTNGISINSVNSVNIVGNWLSEGSYGLYCNSCSLINFTNNTVDSSTGSIGVWLIGGNYNKVTNNNFSRYSFYSIASEGSQYDIIASNFVNASGGQGIGLLSGANYNNVTANNVINAQYDYYISGSNYAYLANNYASAASSYSYYCINSNYGSYTNLSANLSSYGAYLSGCSYTTINNLTSFLNANGGIYVTQGSTNTIENSSFFNNTNYGVYFSGSPSSSLRSSTMYNQVYGLYALYTIGFESNRIFYNNSFYQNQYGAHFQYTTNDYVELSSFFNNSVIGFSFQDNRNLTLVQSEIYNNTLGAKLYGATFTNYNGSLTNTHFYNNGNDLQVQSGGGNTLYYSLNGVLFDNPVGNLTAYTNLSINDTVGGGNNYILSWSLGNSMLPANVTSFRQKFVNMTINSGTPSIDQIQWSWTSAEVVGYNETNLTIYNYNGTNWTKNGGTLNTGSHTLSLSSLSISNAIYGIMDDEIPIPPPFYLVYFVSPTPTNNTNITTSPVVLTLNHINGSVVSPCYFQINGMNQSGTIAGETCVYSFTPTINNTNYNVIGYMNLSGTMVQSNETRTFTWFSTPNPPNPNAGGSGGGSVYTPPINNTEKQKDMEVLVESPKAEQDNNLNICGVIIIIAIVVLGYWATRRK